MERLIQEDFTDSPWKMTVICILLNQTTNQQVRKVLPELFEIIPDCTIASNAQENQIYDVIKSTGFGNVKARRIIQMSKKWTSGFSKPEELPGVGKYALESWSIFVDCKTNFIPSDKKLKLYLETHYHLD